MEGRGRLNNRKGSTPLMQILPCHSIPQAILQDVVEDTGEVEAELIKPFDDRS